MTKDKTAIEEYIKKMAEEKYPGNSSIQINYKSGFSSGASAMKPAYKKFLEWADGLYEGGKRGLFDRGYGMTDIDGKLTNLTTDQLLEIFFDKLNKKEIEV